MRCKFAQTRHTMQIEVRKPKSGQLVFKDTMKSCVAAITKGDYRGDGVDQIVVCAVDGEVSFAQVVPCTMLCFLHVNGSWSDPCLMFTHRKGKKSKLASKTKPSRSVSTVVCIACCGSHVAFSSAVNQQHMANVCYSNPNSESWVMPASTTRRVL